MTEQLSRSDLAGMTPEQIVAANDDGRLDALMGRITPVEPTTDTEETR